MNKPAGHKRKEFLRNLKSNLKSFWFSWFADITTISFNKPIWFRKSNLVSFIKFLLKFIGLLFLLNIAMSIRMYGFQQEHLYGFQTNRTTANTSLQLIGYMLFFYIFWKMLKMTLIVPITKLYRHFKKDKD